MLHFSGKKPAKASEEEKALEAYTKKLEGWIQKEAAELLLDSQKAPNSVNNSVIGVIKACQDEAEQYEDPQTYIEKFREKFISEFHNASEKMKADERTNFTSTLERLLIALGLSPASDNTLVEASPTADLRQHITFYQSYLKEHGSKEDRSPAIVSTMLEIVNKPKSELTEADVLKNVTHVLGVNNNDGLLKQSNMSASVSVFKKLFSSTPPLGGAFVSNVKEILKSHRPEQKQEATK